MEDFDAGGVGLDEFANGVGNVALGFEVGGAGLEEFFEALAELIEDLRSETPHVERDGFVAGEGGDGAVGGGAAGVAAIALDLGELDDVLEVAVGRDLADAARDGAEVGERVAEDEADHGVVGRAGGKVTGELAVAVRAVEIVGVDGGEGLVDDAGGEKDGLGGSPGLGAAGGDGEAWGNVLERLEDVIDGDALFETRADGFAECLLDVFADDEDELAEAGAEGVVDGVVDDGFAGGADGVDLLETAVTAAHAGGENEECGGCWRGHNKGFDAQVRFNSNGTTWGRLQVSGVRGQGTGIIGWARLMRGGRAEPANPRWRRRSGRVGGHENSY